MYILSRLLFFLTKKVNKWVTELFSLYCKKQLLQSGHKFNISYPSSVLSLNCIEIGDNFNTGKGLRLRAYSSYEEKTYAPHIHIGDNFYAGVDCCIAAVGRIEIGNCVTLASRVTIIDHSHGVGDYSDIDEPVMKRNLGIKGDIIIEDNVWICEGAVVLSGIKIGRNSIIGANSVVTKNIPANSIACGIPAKVIKTIRQ